MIPQKLSLSGFLSYRQPVELDFTGLSLACISGANGAGKSSLLDAMTWALFGQARKRDDSVINIHPDVNEAEVVFTFEYESNLYRVQRTARLGKTNSLEFQICQSNGNPDQEEVWKTLSERTQRETQARIESILRMDYDTFINASFFLQGKADQFTQQRPGERKNVLGKILGLEIWEEYRGAASQQRRAVQAQVSELQGRMGEINAELEEGQSRQERLETLKLDLEKVSAARAAHEAALDSVRQAAASLDEQRRMVESLQKQLADAEKRLAGLQERLADRSSERERHTSLIERGDQIRTAYEAWQAARQQLEEMEALADRFRQLDAQRQGPLAEIAATRARLEQEFTSLETREAEIQSKQAQLPELKDQAAAAQASLGESEADVKRRTGLETELEEHRQQRPQMEAENQRLKVEMDELREKIDQLDREDGVECPLCGQPLSQDDRTRLVEALEEQGRQKGDLFRANKTQLEQAVQVERDLVRQIQALSSAPAKVLAHARTVEQLNAKTAQIETECARWAEDSQARLVEIRDQLEAETFCPDNRQELEKIEGLMEALGYDLEAHAALRREETGGRQAEIDLRSLEKVQGERAALDREIAGLEAQLGEYQSEVDARRKEQDRAAEVLAANEAQAPDLEAVLQELDRWRERENQLRMEVGAAQQKVDVLDDLRARRRELENEIERLNLRIGRYRQLETAFGRDGVPALLIEQALPQIESRANRILDRLSDGGMSVHFKTQEAYKDTRREDLRETLNIEISDGSGARDYEMYSGGEAFRVNFAIRLALSEVLAQRAGARLQMLVIDEGFGSQDLVGRQRLVEAINLVKDEFAKILVITHIDALKDVFPSRIEVEKTPQGSQVRVL